MKLYRILIYFLFGIDLSPAQSQSLVNCDAYFQNINKAEICLVRSRYSKADSLYKLAFSQSAGRPFHTDLLYAAISSFASGDTNSSIGYLKWFSQRGGDYKTIDPQNHKNQVLADGSRNLQRFLNLSQQKRLRSLLRRNQRMNTKALDHRAKRKLSRMLFVDQFVGRTLILGLFPRKTRWKWIQKIDDRNFEKIKNLTWKKGKWLGFDVLGESYDSGKNSLSNFDVFLRHFSQDQLFSLDSIVRNSICNLQYYPWTWAGMLDYADIRNERKINDTTFAIRQTYGSLYGYSSKGEKLLIPYNGNDSVNLMRKRLWLSSIEEYAELHGLILNPKPDSVIVVKRR
jgi:hypothetical protein